jgi:hypothetical protein
LVCIENRFALVPCDHRYSDGLSSAFSAFFVVKIVRTFDVGSLKDSTRTCESRTCRSRN